MRPDVQVLLISLQEELSEGKVKTKDPTGEQNIGLNFPLIPALY